MSVLSDALLHPANRPGPLVRRLAALVNPAADLRGLEDGGGTFCDFRAGLEERNASLSASVGSLGAVFHRFGGDGFEGGAVDFVMICLGVGKGEAARLLIEWAGIVDTGPRDRPAPTAGAKAGAALAKSRAMKPLEDPAAALRGWAKLTGEESSPEAEEVARRGLSAALASGLVTAYRFAEQDLARPGKRYTLPGQFMPGVVLLEVRGPDGKAWAFKGRNPGSKAELDAAGKNRYAYPKGSKAAAWCSPELTAAARELWIEGEWNGAAAALGLEDAGYGGAVGVQGVAGSEGLPHTAHLTPGREVYVYADPDKAGDSTRTKGAALAHSLGAKVCQLSGDLFGSGDACDLLPTVGAEALGAKIGEGMKAAAPWQPAEVQPEDGDVWLTKRGGFGLRGGVLCALAVKKDEDTGEDRESVEALCNFAAFITAEVMREDGTGEAARVFEIEGRRSNGQPMHPARVQVTAADFSGMNWPVREWGARAIVSNGQGKKDKAREAMQRLSDKRGITERTVYTHTGWLMHPEHGPVYLTAGAVIGKAGAVKGVEVDLGAGLSAYALPDPQGEGQDLAGAVRSSLALLDLVPDGVGVPVIGAAYRAALGRSDFAVWATGETGRNKTALMGLVMAHYGPGWNRHRLPEGWNSTANALEANSHAVKDALFVIDDFKPGGSHADIDKMHGNLNRTLQGVADGAGRGRMKADGTQRPTLAPRGTVMSSSETLPRGHSNRARVMVVDVAHKLIDSTAKSEAFYAAEDEASSGVYALALAGFVRFLAGHLDAVKAGSPAHKAFVRRLAPRFEGAHGRTGPAAAELAYGWAAFLTFAVELGAVSEGEAARRWARVVAALEDTAKEQGDHLKDADPVHRALSVLSGLLAQGMVFLEDAHGEDAKPPPDEVAHRLGWQAQAWQNEHGEGVTLRTRPGAVLIGYYEKSGGDEWAYFLPEALHTVLQRAVGAQGGAVLPDASTLFGNMKDRLHALSLMRCEVEGGEGKAGRVRPYYKKTVRGTRQRFITLRLPLDLDRYFLGTAGTMGTDKSLSASETASIPVPTYSLFNPDLGTMGTPSLPAPSFFAADEVGEEIDGVMLV